MSERDDELEKLHELTQQLMIRVISLEELLLEKKIIDLDEYQKVAKEKTERFVQLAEQELNKGKILKES